MFIRTYDKQIGMVYEYRREPLPADECDRLVNVCKNLKDEFISWCLRDTGMRVGELTSLTRDQVLWQEGQFVVYRKTVGSERSRSGESCL